MNGPEDEARCARKALATIEFISRKKDLLKKQGLLRLGFCYDQPLICYSINKSIEFTVEIPEDRMPTDTLDFLDI